MKIYFLQIALFSTIYCISTPIVMTCQIMHSVGKYVIYENKDFEIRSKYKDGIFRGNRYVDKLGEIDYIKKGDRATEILIDSFYFANLLQTLNEIGILANTKNISIRNFIKTHSADEIDVFLSEAFILNTFGVEFKNLKSYNKQFSVIGQPCKGQCFLSINDLLDYRRKKLDKEAEERKAEELKQRMLKFYRDLSEGARSQIGMPGFYSSDQFKNSGISTTPISPEALKNKTFFFQPYSELWLKKGLGHKFADNGCLITFQNDSLIETLVDSKTEILINYQKGFYTFYSERTNSSRQFTVGYSGNRFVIN